MLDLVTIGRISVDLYGQEIGKGLSDPQTFRKAVGGSPTNVAIGVARYGHKSAVVTGVGKDELGKYAINELKKFNVSTDFVSEVEGVTPIVVAGVKDPDNPEFVFYRQPQAPDVQIEVTDKLKQAVDDAKIFWFTGSTLSVQPLASTVDSLLKSRGNKEVIFDLYYRPSFWPNQDTASEKISAALKYATVAIGNLQECAVATKLAANLSAVDYAKALLKSGVRLAIVKGGQNGVLVADKNSVTEIAGIRVTTRCGLGAGDAFGAAVVHGILSGWSPNESVAFANAAGAYVASQLMCSDAMPTEEQVRGLLN